jgi:ABC-type nitrate/sulfonate/bicarbonate transport system permease component
MAQSKALEQPVEALDETTLERRAGRRDRWLTSLTFLILFSIWVALTGSGLWEPLIKPIFLPSPVAVFEAFQNLLEGGYQGRSLG